MEEEKYFSDGSVKITNEYIKLGGKSYRLDDIASVKMRSAQTDSMRDVPTFLVISGSILMFTLINLQSIIPVGWEDAVRIGAIAGMLLSIAGLVMLVLSMIMKAEYLYIVHLSGTFGSACPLASDDETYIQNVVASIHRAISSPLEPMTLSQPAFVEKAYN